MSTTDSQPLESNADNSNATIQGNRDGKRGRSAALMVAITAAVVVPWTVFSQFIAHFAMRHLDDHMFGYFGWRITQGAVMYVDIWDNKPPLIYWTNALGFTLGNGHYAGVIALTTTAVIAAHVLFFMISRSLFGIGTAAVATCFATFYLNHPAFESGGNRCETYLVVCELLAAFLYIRSLKTQHLLPVFFAGVFAGAAFLYKQIGLAAFAAMGLHTLLLLATKAVSLKKGLLQGLLIIAGLVFAISAVAFAQYTQGGMHGLKEAYDAIITFNLSYVEDGDSRLSYNYVTWWLTSDMAIVGLKLPLMMAAAGLVHAGLRLWARKPWNENENTPSQHEIPSFPGIIFFLLIWAAVAYYGALASPTRYCWYIIPSVPPILMLATYFLYRLAADVGLLVQIRKRAAIAAICVAMVYFALSALRAELDAATKAYMFRYPDKEKYAGGDNWRKQRHWEVIGHRLAEITEPDDPIQCFGWMPGTYLAARRPNACRFVSTEKFIQVGNLADFITEEIAEAISQKKPIAIAICHGDYERYHGRGLNGGPIPSVLLSELIDENYERVDEIGEFNTYIYKLKAEKTPAP